jgi:GntR family transcriptional regulator
MPSSREAPASPSTGRHILPRYHQLYLSLRQPILDGTFEIGKALPSEQKLADKFGFSRVTVRRTLEILERDGLIERRQGVGTFPVSQKSAQKSVHQNDIYIKYTSAGALDYHNELLAFEYIRTPHFLDASENGFGPVVVKTIRLASLREVPTHLITGHTSARVGDFLVKTELSNVPIIMILKRAGEVVETAGVSIGASTAGAFEANHLGVPLSSPLVIAERISSTGGRPVDHTVIQSRADYFRYSFSVDKETGFLRSSVNPNLFKEEEL